MTAPVLEARGIAKQYGGAHALRGIDFALVPGEVHALIGANGAGKSTLCKIIAGAETPSAGAIWIDGVPAHLSSVRAAAAHGIDMVHQELALFPNLSIADNMFVGRELRDRFGLIDAAAQRRAARDALDRLGHPLDVDLPVGALPIGVQQLVEIGRALVHRTRILLLDEPTSALSAAEVPRLFDVIRALAREGVSIVYISHRLDELLEIADRITVLRDGEIVAAAPTAGLDVAWIVAKMTGAAPRAERVASLAAGKAPMLRVRGLSLAARANRVGLHGIDLDVAAGEVVGLFGLLGAGRSELLEALIGAHRDAKGGVWLGALDLSRMNAAARVKAGIVLTPEHRQRDALFPNMSVLHNATLSALGSFTRPLGVDAAQERARLQELAGVMRLRAPSLDAPIGALSGGNQQKVVLSRCLMAAPKLLLLDEPTRGVDVAAKADILEAIHALAAQGLAVIFTSSEPSEVVSAATRIVVMSRGMVSLTGRPEELDEATLSAAAAIGAREARVA